MTQTAPEMAGPHRAVKPTFLGLPSGGEAPVFGFAELKKRLIGNLTPACDVKLQNATGNSSRINHD